MTTDRPETQYTWASEVCIAYQVMGEGPVDLVVVPGLVSHVEFFHEMPGYTRFLQRLATFARVVTFDKRGQGLSDGITGAPSLEERMDDLRAVMEAVGLRRAAIFGFSEGGPMAALFAATYPEATQALILYGSFARFTVSEDYPHAVYDLPTYIKSVKYWGTGASLKTFAPRLARDNALVELWAKGERLCTTPGGFKRMLETNARIDIRPILPGIRIPTLVMHRATDRAVFVENGRYLAEHIPGARYQEWPDGDHAPMLGDNQDITDAIEEFLTGKTHAEETYDTTLATVLFMDIVHSSEIMTRIGDHDWRDLLDAHDRTAEEQVRLHRGRIVKSTGDGLLATFNGPSRAVGCARAIRDRLHAFDLETRAGLHIGEVELRGDDISGLTVNIAARVQSEAAPGMILVTRTITDLVPGSNLEFDDRGPHELKGIPGRWQLLELI